MTSYGTLEATGVLHPVQPLLVLAIVVAFGEEAVALDSARRVEHELVELYEAQSKPRGFRLGEDTDPCVDLVNVALVHDLELASQLRVATRQLEEGRHGSLAHQTPQVVIASGAVFTFAEDV